MAKRNRVPAVIDETRQQRARRVAPRAKVLSVGDVEGQRTARLGPPGEAQADAVEWTERLSQAFGTTSPDFTESALLTLAQMSVPEGGSEHPSEPILNGLLATVSGVAPRDEVEAMLAVQMATTHAFAMACLRRAHVANDIQRMDANGHMATKMLRTFTAQVEALAKLRRGGEQTVRVEHVHVYPGGQAIVGHVEHRGGGGDEIGRQAREANDIRALGFATGAPMWSPEPPGAPVQARGSKRKGEVPAARRSGR